MTTWRCHRVLVGEKANEEIANGVEYFSPRRIRWGKKKRGGGIYKVNRIICLSIREYKAEKIISKRWNQVRQRGQNVNLYQRLVVHCDNHVWEKAFFWGSSLEMRNKVSIERRKLLFNKREDAVL